VGVSRVAVIAATVIGVAGAVRPLHAQQAVKITMGSSIGGPGPGGMISKRSLDRYAKTLAFSAEQTEQAVAVHSGYVAAYRQKQKEASEAIQEVARSAEDSGDHSVFMEKMPAIEKARSETSAKLETEFFNDLKALLTASQEDLWPKVQRLRRRELGLRGGGVSGENMDVIDLCDGLKLEGDAAKSLALVLDQYELDLDRLLVAKESAKKDEPGWEPGKPIDIEKIQAAMAKAKEEGAKIRDLNKDAARKVLDLVPEDQRASFEAAIRRKTYPSVYRQPRVLREVEAALKFNDVDASQREQLTQLASSYAKELEPLNASWAKAIEEQESSGEGGNAGGISMMFGEEPEGLRNARKARREADEAARTKLKGILNKDQQERLPKGNGPSEEGGDEEGMVEGAAGNMIMIRRSE
jgi:hypothetical protein